MPDIAVTAGPVEYQYKGKIVSVYTQKMKIGEKEVVYERARRSPGTRLIIISPENKILLTHEHRAELNDHDYRLPGGKVFDALEDYLAFVDSGKDIIETAKEAAKREAVQETGLEIADPEYYYTSKAGATVEWDLYYFIVKNFEVLKSERELELGEDIQVGWYSFDEARKLALSTQMKEDRSAAVLLRYLESEK